jgi:PAS domain S-box-containing protein
MWERIMRNRDTDLIRLRSQVAALEELLAVQEQAVLDRSERLEQVLTKLSERARQLEQTEDSLREGEARYRSLAVATSQIIWATNARGETLGDMPSWRNFTGQSAEQTRGWGWLEAVHPEDRDHAERAWRRALASGSLYETEYRLRKYDGTYRLFTVRGVPVIEGKEWGTAEWPSPDFTLHGVPLVDDPGRIREWVGTCTDITEQREAEQTLLASEQRTRLIVDTAHDAFVGMDARGVITDWNTQAQATFGWSREEVLGRPLAETIIPQRFRETHRRGLARYLATGEGPVLNQRIEMAALRRDGSEFPVELTIAPIPLGQEQLFGAFIRDITERKLADERIRATLAELERSNRDLEQFAYVVSHDLQEPLRMVASYCQILQQQYRGRLDAEADEYIEFAVDGARRMQVMIQDLLALSRVGTRGEPLEPTESAAALAAAVRNLDARVRELDARITYGELPAVSADFTQLVQLFQNLISNALKFRGGGQPQVHVAAQRADGEWVFSVRDNGIGIEPQHTKRIFEVFCRLHSRDQYPGTGIGLAICKRIVQRHGGRIWVESQPGAGSTFYFSIPVRAPRHTRDRALARETYGDSDPLPPGTSPQWAT